MTAKEYLNQVFRKNKSIDADLLEVQQLRSLAESIGAIDYAKDRVQSTPTNALENSIVKLMTLEEKINAEIDEYVDLKEEIRCKINQLSNDKEQALLKMRYISLLTWEKIAVELDISIRYTYTLHGQALQSFTEKFSNL